MTPAFLLPLAIMIAALIIHARQRGWCEAVKWWAQSKQQRRCECRECDPVAGLRNPCVVTGGGWDDAPPDAPDASEPAKPIWPPRGKHYAPHEGSTPERDERAEREAQRRAVAEMADRARITEEIGI